MAPPIDRDEAVKVPLTQFVREIAKEAAQTVIDNHESSCPVAKELAKMHADVYGLPGEKGRSPGLMGDVAELRQSRKYMRWGLRSVWAAVLVVFGKMVGNWW